jgi:hypothetical protein
MFNIFKKVEKRIIPIIPNKASYFISYNIFDINELPVGSGWVVIRDIDIDIITTSDDILELEGYIEANQKLNKIVINNFIKVG